MVGVLLVAHGHLTEAMIDSAKMIMGDEIPAYEALTLELGEDLSLYTQRFLDAIHRLDTGDGVLVLADLFAGTPANVALQNLQAERYGLVTGMNLAMVIEALSNRDGATLSEVKEMALEAAQISLVDINQKLNVKEKD